MAQVLLSPELPHDSAVLSEKLAELDDRQGLTESCIKELRNALKFNPTPQQRVRLTLTLADKLTAARREAEALALCDRFLKDNPDIRAKIETELRKQLGLIPVEPSEAASEKASEDAAKPMAHAAAAGAAKGKPTR